MSHGRSQVSKQEQVIRQVVHKEDVMTKGKDGPNGSLHDGYGEVSKKKHNIMLLTSN
jgi:hypothetical protein